MKGHNGLDLYAPDGYPVFYCAPAGFVEELVDEPSRGLGLGIITNEKFETGQGEYQVKTRYWHLKSFNVKKGDKVEPGDLIGFADNTGFSSGSHLHLEVKPVHVVEGRYYNTFQNNGFYGAIDPGAFFTGRYAQDVAVPKFTKNMRVGQRSKDVERLQYFLQKRGYFPTWQEPTGFYGEVTRSSVFKFQEDHVQLSWYDRWVLKGTIAGEKTRAALNALS
jgi:murein DD-endopeptidase MepM/ murein hydrolase activator NlpD